MNAFVDLVALRSFSLLRATCRSSGLARLYSLARCAANFIGLVVENSLIGSPPKGLDWLAALAKNGTRSLDIVTLNHDTLVEQVLSSHGIEYSDGFGVDDGELRWQHELSFDSTVAGVRLIKPHGSVNWKHLAGAGAAMAVVNDPTKDAWLDASGREWRSRSKESRFLTGVGKVVSYNSGVFAEMTYQFHKALRSNSVMLMAGYGWCDVGINLRIESWLDKREDHTMILFHRDPDSLRRASLQIDQSYRGWEDAGKLVLHEKWPCDASVEEIEAAVSAVEA